MGHIFSGPVVQQKNGRYLQTWSQYDLKALRRFYLKQGHTLRECIVEFGVKHAALQKILNEQGWMRSKISHKIIAAKYKHMVKDYEKGLMISDICKKYGTNITEVEKLFKRNGVTRPLSVSFKISSRRKLYVKQHIRNTIQHKVSIDRILTFAEYEDNARKLTEAVFRLYGKHIPGFRFRSVYFHIDHMISIQSAFNWKTGYLDFKYLCHPSNFQILTNKSNVLKGNSNHLTLNQLKVKIRNFEQLHGKVFQ